SHEDRPALIMVNSGEIAEHSSKCLVPIVHKAGDIARESLGTRHWWKNSGSLPVELAIADIVNDRKPDTMMGHMGWHARPGGSCRGRSCWCCKAAARSGPIKPASTRRCTRPASSRTG